VLDTSCVEERIEESSSTNIILHLSELCMRSAPSGPGVISSARGILDRHCHGRALLNLGGVE
jgi:hypothetical protein